MLPSENHSGKRRLDDLLVRRGLFPSRSRARDAILRGTVSVDGRADVKPGQAVPDTVAVEVRDPARGYVSRAALKLAAALDHFGLDPKDATALDIGASTGGFTQVLLERGAARVFALDVGHGQLHELIRNDRRVVSIEGMNARDLASDDIGGAVPDFLVSDVSFISLRLALPPPAAFSWSSRSSRPGAMRSARAVFFAIPPTARGLPPT